MNYRSITGCFSRVEGNPTNNSWALRAPTHRAIHTDYLRLGWSLNSIFNLHNSIQQQKRPTEDEEEEVEEEEEEEEEEDKKQKVPVSKEP